MLKLFDSMFDAADFPEGFRSAIDLRGFNFGKGRQPLTKQQSTALATAAEKNKHVDSTSALNSSGTLKTQNILLTHMT